MKKFSNFSMQRCFLFKSLAATLLLLVTAMCMSSCNSVLYNTVGQNVPLFQEKGEVALSAGVGTTLRTAGLNAQAAVAVSNSWLLMSSLYSFQVSSAGLFVPIRTGSGTYFELGAGKYKYNSETRICREIVFGVGFGSVSNSYNIDYLDVSYIKPFIQPSWGFSTKNFEAAVTPRIGLVSYISKSASAAEQAGLDAFYSSRKNTFVFEPGFTLRGGTRSVKLQVQYNYTTFNYQLVNDNLSTTFTSSNPVDRWFLSVGFFVLISNRWGSDK